MAVYILILLTIGMVMSFYLAVMSINNQYVGSLACWTIVFTPLGATLSIVLQAVVKKNQDENTSADGDGIKYRTVISGEEATI